MGDRLVATQDKDADYWRNRYYQGVERLERQEKEWQDAEGVLRRGLSRITLTTEGLDRGLDEQLSDLREALRRGVPALHLHERFERLSHTLTTVEDRQGRQRALIPAVRQLLAQLITDVHGGQPLTKTAAVLQVRLREARDVDALQGLLEEFAVVVRAVPVPTAALPPVPPSPVEPRSQGFWQRLFGARSQLPPRVETVAGPRRASKTTHGETAASKGASASALLAALLDQVSFPRDLDQQLNTLHAWCRGEISAAQLPEAVDALVKLISATFAHFEHQKRDLEGFLVQLTEHLHDINEYVQGSTEERSESHERGRRFQATVSEQVDDLMRSMHGTLDIAEIKNLVQTRLRAVEQSIKHHREGEEQRYQQSEQQVREMRARMGELEYEVTGLHERIRQERGKALLDPLTGIANRLAYNERLGVEFARWRRYKQPLSTILWDIDHFKAINDRFGHQVGDQVILAVGKFLAGKLRETDFVARYGGEEFVAILPQTQLHQALEAAEKIRCYIADEVIRAAGVEMRVTVSAGVAQFREQDDPEDVFRRADIALYNAKTGGRNHCCAEEPVAAPSKSSLVTPA